MERCNAKLGEQHWRISEVWARRLCTRPASSLRALSHEGQCTNAGQVRLLAAAAAGRGSGAVGGLALPGHALALNAAGHETEQARPAGLACAAAQAPRVV